MQRSCARGRPNMLTRREPVRSCPLTQETLMTQQTLATDRFRTDHVNRHQPPKNDIVITSQRLVNSQRCPFALMRPMIRCDRALNLAMGLTDDGDFDSDYLQPTPRTSPLFQILVSRTNSCQTLNRWFNPVYGGDGIDRRSRGDRSLPGNPQDITKWLSIHSVILVRNAHRGMTWTAGSRT